MPQTAQVDGAVSDYVGEFLHRCHGEAGTRLFTQLRQEEIERAFARLTLDREKGLRRAPGERLTLRREHLKEGELNSIGEPSLDLWLAQRARELGVELRQKRWPGGRPFAACLSHDMDHVAAHNTRACWRRAFRTRALRSPETPSWKLLAGAARGTAAALVRRHLLREEDRFDNVHQWMDLEAGHNLRSTLYFLPSEIAPWHPYDPDFTFSDTVSFRDRPMRLSDMIRAIDREGWEIGLHGTVHSATNQDVLAGQKRQLENLVGKPVRTVRQHFLQYDPVETPAIHENCGLIGDGTHGFNDLLGFRAGTAFPYHAWDGRKQAPLGVLEIPLHIQDGALFNAFPGSGDALAECGRIMDQVEQVGGCLSILFHPWHLSTERGFGVYAELLAGLRRRNAWLCGSAELVDWWEAGTARPDSAAEATDRHLDSQ